MQNLRYLASDDWQKQFATAVRKNVNAYFKERGISTKGDHRIVVKSLVMLAMYIVPFVLMLALPLTGWWAMGMWVLMGVGMAGIGMGVMHDAVHGSASDHPWVNKLMSWSIYLMGANVFNWKIQHNLIHHTHTNVNDVDQDIASRGPLRFSEHAPLRGVHRFQHISAFFIYGLLTLSKLVRDFFTLAKFNRSGLTQKHGISPTGEFVTLGLTKALHVGVLVGLPILLTPAPWWLPVLGFLLMHFVTGVILGVIFQLAHVVEGADQPLPDDRGVINTEWAVHEVLTTANFARNNRLLNWYIGGLNFQIEHHLFPHICHIHYRHIAPIVERTAKEYGLKYNEKPTFRAALVSHVRRLRELGRPKMVAVPVKTR